MMQRYQNYVDLKQDKHDYIKSYKAHITDNKIKTGPCLILYIYVHYLELLIYIKTCQSN